MKAIQVRQPGGLDRLDYVSLPDPGAPGPGEVLVRVRASSLNFHDYMVATGGVKTANGRVPMSDGAGEVIAAGDGVAWRAGTLVVSTFFPTWLDGPPRRGDFVGVPGDGVDGFACELVRAPASAFTLGPAGYTHREAATLTCAGLTAWRSLIVEGGLKAGDSVLVQGTGGVSVFALQFAKAMGAVVIATSSSEEKLARLRALGADHVLNYRAVPEWGEAVRDLSGGRGVDHVVEIGGAGTLPQSLAAVRAGGHVSLIGVLAGWQGAIPTVEITTKQIRLIGLTVGSRTQQVDMIRAIEATGIRPVIDRAFPLDGLADAFRYQESGRHFGKIVVDIPG